MATKHTCTIDVRCLKQHTCIACGGQFSYLFARKVVGTADTPQGASVAAEASARQQITSDVDNHPCPTCGVFQPDMIGSRRLSAQRIMWMLSVVAVVVLFILSVSHILQDDVFVPTALVVLGVTGLIQLAIDARRPNRDLDSNRQKAQGLVDRGTLRLDTAGRPPQNFDEPWRPQKSLLPLAALVLFLAALAAIAAPKIMCVAGPSIRCATPASWDPAIPRASTCNSPSAV